MENMTVKSEDGELFKSAIVSYILEDSKGGIKMLKNHLENVGCDNDMNNINEDQEKIFDGYQAMNNSSLIEEEKTNSAKRTFMCKLCNKEYGYSYRKRHMAIHKGLKTFKCNECNKGFSDKCNLKSHMRVHYESLGAKDFCCQECGKKFALKVYLRKHMVLHTGKRPYQCTMCEKAYNRKADLNTHVLVHEGRNFSCNLCDKRYVCKKQLKDHIKVHEGLKEYVCKVCGKGFSISSGLRSHMAVHDTEGKHVCEVCGKTCRRRSNLQDHMLTHSDVRDFKCSVCGKEFARRMSLRKHMVLHTKAEVHLMNPLPVVDPLIFNNDSEIKLDVPTSSEADESTTHYINVEVDCIIKEEDSNEYVNSDESTDEYNTSRESSKSE